MKKTQAALKQNGQALDSKFWSYFVKNIWEKKSIHVESIKSELVKMDPIAIFDLLVLYSNHCRKIKNAEGFKFYINGMQTFGEDILQVLPVKKDKDLLGYHSRMSSLFSDYCLVCDELLKTNVANQALLTHFTDDLYQYIGFPNRFTEMGLYLGNYRKTPFGVHVDACGVFSFPVVGTKRFRIWTAEYVKKNPSLNRAFKYEKFKKDSQLLQANPGDMTYWPSSAWHIAESDGSFSATWSLGVWVDKPHRETFIQSLAEVLANKMGSSGSQPMTSFLSLYEETGEVCHLPKSYLDSIKILQNLKSTEIQEALSKSWMQHISKKGFKNSSSIDVKIDLHSRVQLRDIHNPILWQQGRTKKRSFFFSYDGRLVESSKDGNLIHLVMSLNTGKACLIKDYLTGQTKNNDLNSLKQLAQAGAFS